jgi:hypothetical protein
MLQSGRRVHPAHSGSRLSAVTLKSNATGGVGMAYLVRSSSKDPDLLNYELQGGNPELAIDVPYQGRVLREADLATFFSFSLPVPPEMTPAVPTRIIVKPRSDAPLPDFGMIGPAARLNSALVSDRFVALVERLEPNMHQFLPIKECVDGKGRRLGRSFFLMNVLTRLEAIDIERSDVEWITTRFPDRTEMTTLVAKPVMNLTLVLRRNVTNGYHLWRGGKRGLLGYHFISNELHDLIKQAGLSPLRLTKCEEA